MRSNDPKASFIASGSTHSTVYYSFDLRGNTTNRTVQSGADGVIQTSAFYNAYGARGSTNYDADPYDGFGGQYGYRKETGAAWIYLCGERYYSPDEGRFISRDPIGYAGGINLYSYCGNNPVNGVDPTGLSGGGFPDPFDDSPSQDKYYTSNLVGRGSGIPAANAFFRSVSAWIPGVGPLLGFHEALTGCDVTGTPVSNLDRGIGALPLLGAVGPILGKLKTPAASIVKQIASVGRFNHEAGSLAEAEALLRQAYPEAEVVEEAVNGIQRAEAVDKRGPWWQIHPSEPGVHVETGPNAGMEWPHIKYEDWTRGKKSNGGSWGHIFFPPGK